jgi:hypothetical protein
MDYCFDGEWFLRKNRKPSNSDGIFKQMSIDVLPSGGPPLVVLGDNGSPSENYPLGECQGGKSVLFFYHVLFLFMVLSSPLVCLNNSIAFAFSLSSDCDSDLDCEYGLSCFHTMIEGHFRNRNDETTVDGCNGFVASYKDYCYNPPVNTLVRMGRDKKPTERYPLDMCQGGTLWLFL